MGVRIAIASYGTFEQFIHQIKPFYSEEVEFVILNALFEDLKDEVRRLEKDHSVDVFVGSGGNGRFLEKYVQETPFVKVKVTGFDFLLALKKAAQYGKCTGLITFGERVPFVSSVKELLNVEVTERVYHQSSEIDQVLADLYNQGIEDVIGTAFVLERAALKGMRGHYIWSVDGVKTAVDTAVQVALAKRQDAKKAHKLASILQTIHEGVIVTDEQGIVNEFNTSAEKILKIDRGDVMGRPVQDVLPNTRLNVVIERQREEYNKIQDVGNVKILTNRCPIFSQGRLIGALATFQSIEEVSEAEGKIRRKLYTRGFVAGTRFEDMQGACAAFQDIVHIGREYAKSDATILISGETGTGKELFAQSLHNESDRSRMPFVAINCAAVPPNILESELFGYEEGAFTGARRGGKKGVFELAHEGTLFLDEIGEISMDIQLRFLRALEQREVFRLGGEKVVPVDIRVIAATNKNLWQMVKEGKFREDLYYRLNVLAIHLPALRDRREDIPLLINHFLREFRPDLPDGKRLELAGIPFLRAYRWPGNIRELRNVVERMAVLYKDGMDAERLAMQALSVNEEVDGGWAWSAAGGAGGAAGATGGMSGATDGTAGDTGGMAGGAGGMAGAADGMAGATGGIAGATDGMAGATGGVAGAAGGIAGATGGATGGTGGIAGATDGAAGMAGGSFCPTAPPSPASPLPLSSWILADRQRRERDEILLALRQCGGSRTQAARLLGVSRSTLWRKMQALGILANLK
ncbi:sigma 54-interacting transcriptional regulator [Enterocloster lavalensis]|mgnify:CR=1 FL=1|uniref:sigma 54-interacting transcriptional regulator n=1 Tax=Enterocloster lavalensis TaxID=460384 RepID=UPI001D060961|nr:sigma 54-interacting transcriptional regulator [Enterocloster lavalensis]MCB6346889.1 sigma 54-interacting transcriptional regulator [Enterocloster lavalensis]